MTGAVVAASGSRALANLVVAYGAGAQIAVSTDAGATWTSVRTALLAAGWSSTAAITAALWMPTRKRLWIGGVGGAGAYTEDRGVTWTYVAAGTADVLSAAYDDASDTALVGMNTSAASGFKKSLNGGGAWSNEDFDAAGTLVASKIRSGNGWLVAMTNGNPRAAIASSLSWTGLSVTPGANLVVFTGARWIAGLTTNLFANTSTNPNTGTFSALSGEPLSTVDMASDGTYTLSVGDNRAVGYITSGSAWSSAVTPTGIASTEDFVSCDYSVAQGRFFAITAQASNANIPTPNTGTWTYGTPPTGVTAPNGIICCDAAA